MDAILLGCIIFLSCPWLGTVDGLAHTKEAARANVSMSLELVDEKPGGNYCPQDVVRIDICVDEWTGPGSIGRDCKLYKEPVYTRASCVSHDSKKIIAFTVADVTKQVELNMNILNDADILVPVMPKTIKLIDPRSESLYSHDNKFRVKVEAITYLCLPNYFGQLCDLYCPPDKAAFTCDERGRKICRMGYYKPSGREDCFLDVCATQESYCRNDGQCVNPLPGISTDPTCKCPSGFEGKYCEAISTVAPPPRDTTPTVQPILDNQNNNLIDPNTSAMPSSSSSSSSSDTDFKPTEVISLNLTPPSSLSNGNEISWNRSDASLGKTSLPLSGNQKVIHLQLIHVAMIVFTCLVVGALIGISIYSCTRTARKRRLDRKRLRSALKVMPYATPTEYYIGPPQNSYQEAGTVLCQNSYQQVQNSLYDHQALMPPIDYTGPPQAQIMTLPGTGTMQRTNKYLCTQQPAVTYMDEFMAYPLAVTNTPSTTASTGYGLFSMATLPLSDKQQRRFSAYNSSNYDQSSLDIPGEMKLSSYDPQTEFNQYRRLTSYSKAPLANMLLSECSETPSDQSFGIHCNYGKLVSEYPSIGAGPGGAITAQRSYTNALETETPVLEVNPLLVTSNNIPQFYSTTTTTTNNNSNNGQADHHHQHQDPSQLELNELELEAVNRN